MQQQCIGFKENLNAPIRKRKYELNTSNGREELVPIELIANRKKIKN